MKHIFIARHADYGKDDRINDKGRQKSLVLSEAIKEITLNGSVYIISSTSPRAMDTAEVLASNLGVTNIEPIEYLWAADDSPKGTFEYDISNGYTTLDSIIKERENRADALIMMTHFGVLSSYPYHFLSVFLDVDAWKDEFVRTVDKGQALYADLESKTYRKIPRFV